MKHDYARKKLEALLRDLDSYTTNEFECQMLRITEGATGINQDKIDWEYPKEAFMKLISTNSPYAFYILQWVPYQKIKDEITAQKWRLKMTHEVKHFDGRVKQCPWPNGSHMGPFHDDEVEFIRISPNQFGIEYKDPRNEETQ